jgi:hypothetical protein
LSHHVTDGRRDHVAFDRHADRLVAVAGIDPGEPASAT